jgi:hypothetical protein
MNLLCGKDIPIKISLKFKTTTRNFLIRFIV